MAEQQEQVQVQETPIQCKINKAKDLEGKLVTFKGWAYHIRKARKTLIFVELRDGTGYVQCVIWGDDKGALAICSIGHLYPLSLFVDTPF